MADDLHYYDEYNPDNLPKGELLPETFPVLPAQLFPAVYPLHTGDIAGDQFFLPAAPPPAFTSFEVQLQRAVVLIDRLESLVKQLEQQYRHNHPSLNGTLRVEPGSVDAVNAWKEAFSKPKQ